MLISICIPSYNRPKELYRLLNSIDVKLQDSIEIIICEDLSPKRNKIRDVVNAYKDSSSYNTKYIENKINLGYDKNLQELISNAKGEFIVFMGDDDEFIPNALDKLIKFLSSNSQLGYVLKSHQYIFKNGKIEKFRYFEGNQFFKAGEETYLKLFRKSVFISGFTINRIHIRDLRTDRFNGSLLYQLYLLAEVSINHDCAYFDTPLTMAREEGIPYFGNAESEKGLYTPGTITIKNSVNFLNKFFDITNYIDNKYSLSSTQKIRRDMSKYFYPNLAIQRDKGLSLFFSYVKHLNKMGFNCTIYYYIYVIALTILGKSFCDKIIRILKEKIGKTPEL